MARTTSLKFGWLPRKSSYSTPMAQVSPLPGIEKAIAEVNNSDRVGAGWFYPPLIARRGTEPSADLLPRMPHRWFTLPTTHRIDIQRNLDPRDRLPHFLVLVLGLLCGIRLLPAGWGHFYKTPIREGTLCDFEPSEPAIEHCLSLAESFWTQHSGTNAPTRILGAIHWHLFGDSYEHSFERFGAQYTVLDAAWTVHQEISKAKGKTPHAQRAAELALHYRVPVPQWASLTNGKTSILSEVRNKLIHEGFYGEEPIGFTHPTRKPNIDFELKLFNTRLLLALIGLSDSVLMPPGYIGTSVSTHSTYYLALK